MHLAALSGSSAALHILLGQPESRDMLVQQDSRGYSPLHHAASRGHYIAALMLLKRNPQALLVRCKEGSTGGYTPLNLAMQNQDKRTVYALFEYGKAVVDPAVLAEELELGSMKLSVDFRRFLVQKDYENARFDTLRCLYPPLPGGQRRTS